MICKKIHPLQIATDRIVVLHSNFSMLIRFDNNFDFIITHVNLNKFPTLSTLQAYLRNSYLMSTYSYTQRQYLPANHFNNKNKYQPIETKNQENESSDSDDDSIKTIESKLESFFIRISNENYIFIHSGVESLAPSFLQNKDFVFLDLLFQYVMQIHLFLKLIHLMIYL